MKTFASRQLGLVGVLLLAAGCGGSNGEVGGSPDGSADGTTPGSDGQASTSEDGGAGNDAPATAEDGGVCGDGVVEGNEECDDGAANGTAGDGCTAGCTWICIQGNATRGDAACSDGNPCNGAETCQANHTCAAGTPPPTGTSCGTGEICNNDLCAQAVCGDGIVTPPEECDDGSNNGSPTDGCTKTCMFVCVSTDPTRDCTPTDPCQGQGTCNNTTHTCTAGTVEGNGTICSGGTLDGGVADAAAGGDAGTIEVCKAGTCVVGYCGDGVLEPPEQCDFGAGNGAGTGCETDCKFSCTTSPNSCTQPVDACAGTNACTPVVVGGDTGQHCVQGSPLNNGTACGAGNAGTCQSGVCQTALCGNGVLNTGEQCDFGAGNNVTGSGCEPDCQFSCQKTPTDTCQTNVCAASPTICTTDTGPNSTPGQKCEATTELAACGDCSATGVCVSNQCAPSVCGDGCVDSRTGETCDPPNGTTCDAQCHLIVCGDGKREGLEQCDDGNTKNLDGCDSTCHFEQDQRANGVTIEFGTDSYCAHNALGSAIASAAQSTLSSDLSSSVTSGATSIEFKFMGITDLTGTAQTTGLALGVLSGTPAAAPTGVTYNGNSDLDWWYTTAASTIDANRNPLSQTPATFAAKVLSAKNGTISITISIAGASATLAISSANIQADIGATSTPTVSTGQTPGHLASENLDPTLVSFASMNNGLLCGNISAASLATVPVPTALLPGGGISSCTNVTYSTSNSLLDVLVTGCNAFLGIAAINKTQPDQVTGAPQAGAGPAYTLSANSSYVVSKCTDHTGATITPLSTCLAAAAYSSYFGFTSDRIIAK